MSILKEETYHKKKGELKFQFLISRLIPWAPVSQHVILQSYYEWNSNDKINHGQLYYLYFCDVFFKKTSSPSKYFGYLHPWWLIILVTCTTKRILPLQIKSPEKKTMIFLWSYKKTILHYLTHIFLLHYFFKRKVIFYYTILRSNCTKFLFYDIFMAGLIENKSVLSGVF